MPLDGCIEGALAPEIRRSEFPPDVQHVLDNMIENDHLDDGTYAVIKLYAPHRQVMDLVDETPQRRATYVTPLGLALMAIADDILQRLPHEIAGGYAFASAKWLQERCDRISEVICNWAHEDETTGGAMKAFRDRPRLLMSGHPSPRTARRLHAPGFIDRQVKRTPEVAELRQIANIILDRVARIPVAYRIDTMHDQMVAFAEQREDARRAALAAFGAAEIAAPTGRSSSPLRTAAARKRQRRERQIIKRATKTATQFLEPADVSAFARGEAVRLAGREVDLMVSAGGRLGREGHSGVEVTCVEHTSGERLADLCVYIKDTPALDQLTGFALLMGAGDEKEILRTANVIRVHAAGKEHPLLKERIDQRLRERAANPGNWTTIYGRDRRNNITVQREIRAAYLADTGKIWRDRTCVHVLGRRAKLLAVG